MARVLVHLAHGHLMGTPVALRPLTVDLLRAGPPLGRAEHEHRPQRPLRGPVAARIGFDAPDLLDDRVQRASHELMHRLGLLPFDEIRRVAVPSEQMVQLLVTDPRQHARIGDLVPVEVEDREDHAVGRRVEELVRMPARRQGPGFRFPVAHHSRDNQIRVVERRAACRHYDADVMPGQQAAPRCHPDRRRWRQGRAPRVPDR